MQPIILNPRHGDMSVIVLGKSVTKIKERLKEKHWDDVYEWPLTCSEEQINLVHAFMAKDHISVSDLMKDYNSTFDEDYIMEESY